MNAEIKLVKPQYEKLADAFRKTPIRLLTVASVNHQPHKYIITEEHNAFFEMHNLSLEKDGNRALFLAEAAGIKCGEKGCDTKANEHTYERMGLFYIEEPGTTQKQVQKAFKKNKNILFDNGIGIVDIVEKPIINIKK